MKSTLTHFAEMKELIHAAKNNYKIKLRLRSTPRENYILFHPYAVFVDTHSGKEKIYGLIESHYANDISNQTFCISIDKIAELIPVETVFEKPKDWRSQIDENRYEPKYREPADLFIH